MSANRRSTLAAGMLAALLFAPPGPSGAEESGLRHIRTLGDASSPPASIEELAWIAGSWTGSGFGGEIEEIWSRPSAGSMVGLYKHRKGDAINFYEIQILVEEEGSLVWKVKHFGADFVGWEEKEGYTRFPLVALTEEAAYFDGLTVARRGEDGITIWLRVRSGDDVREEEIVYRRAPLPGD